MSSSKKSFYISWIIGLTFSILAVVFLLIGWTGYGLSLFCILPIALGISSGILPDRKWALYGLFVALGIFLLLLVTGGVEGFVCILMAIPILVPFVFLGYLIAAVFRHFSKKNKDTINASIFYPFAFFILGSFIEMLMGNPKVREATTTSVVLAATPAEVYRNIIHVDTVDVETNFMHTLGLPVPRKCILTEEKIGGKRICVFEEGEIVETIKDLKQNELLKMDVSASDMLGMRWLKFDEDIYKIEKTASGTRITRTTTYYSELKPRFYWKMIEDLTIGSEQEFVFRNLQTDLVTN